MLKYIPQLQVKIAFLAEDSTVAIIDTASSVFIDNNFNFVDGDFTYLKLQDSAFSEVVKVINKTGNSLLIERAVDNTVAQNFNNAVGTSFLGPSAFQDLIAQYSTTADINIEGQGALEVERTGNTFTLVVPIPTIEAADSTIDVTGEYPQFELAANNAGCCGDDEDGSSGTGGVANLSLSGIISGYISGGQLYLEVPTPYFQGSGGITVTGDYPYYTISGVGGGGGGTNVAAGQGIVVTGNPSVNPTVSIQNTGVTAGDYNGFVVLSTGQIAQIPDNFNPISEITSESGALQITTVGATTNIDIVDAEVGVRGAVALADSGEPLDPDDDESAATPALVAAALASLTGVAGIANGSYAGEADADYNNVLSSTSFVLNVPAGRKAILIGQATAVDNTDPTVSVVFALAIFKLGAVRIAANKKISQCQQTIIYLVEGPFNDTISLVATTPTNATMQSQYLTALQF